MNANYRFLWKSRWHGPKGDWSQANNIDLLTAHHRVHFNYDDMIVTPDDTRLPIADAQVINIDAAFVQAVRTGDQSLILSSYEDGVRSLAVSLAANESARTGQPVAVGKMLEEIGL